MTEAEKNSKITILIAEDDSLISKTVQMFLKREEYTIIASCDGREALEKFEKHNPNLVITDIMMPYISGLEIVGKIKQSNNPVPVIVSSSMSQPEVAEEAKRLGADAFVSKPYNITELLSCISSLVGAQEVA